MEFNFGIMKQREAEQIADDWKYNDEYSFYDMAADIDDYLEFVNMEKRADKYFSCYLNKELMAWYSAEVLDDDKIELGLGLKPQYTGKGLGVDFVNAVIKHATSIYGNNGFILSVALFNQRAIKVYEKVGFTKISMFTQNTNGDDHKFLKMSLLR